MNGDRVTMTWPDYKKRQCSIGRFIVRLSTHETKALSTLLMRYPHPMLVDELIESVYEIPDDEPDFARDIVYGTIYFLRRRFGRNFIQNRKNMGYVLSRR